jgi:L-lactate dehydrogenase complex protein LldG
MSATRTSILARIDRALRTARIPETHGAAQTAPHEADARRPLQSAGPANESRAAAAVNVLRDRFLAEGRGLGVETFVEASPAAVRERLATVVGGLRVLSWNAEHLPYDAGSVLAGALAGSAPLRDQARADIGVTGCHAAIAETGSLVLLSGAGTARTVSLLPAVHVALLRPEDFVPTMAEYFAVDATRMANRSCCTFVTGPSRTADIELSLTIGVHGPGRLIVIIGP